jgi:hypothetical protein
VLSRSQWSRGLSYELGRAIAQAVSRWLPTSATRVQNRVLSCGICGRQSGAGAGFLRVLRFSLPIFIPPISPQSPSSIIRGWYNRPVVATVPKVPPRKLKKKKGMNCLRSLESWDRGFESDSRHGCLCLFCVCVR